VLDGRVIVLTGDHVGLADHLRALGATVHESFDAAVAAEAPIDVVVYAPAVAPAAQSLAETSESEWDARGEAQLRAGLAACQRAFTHLRERGGRIILVTPTAALVGEAGFVPIATASAGLRSLAKVAARQWGEHGITVNCVAPSLALLGAEVPEPVDPPALGRAATAEDLARTIAVLAGDGAASITGATITVDGGVVMLP
jgi:NAD(P)-dependent dehydrogenase (short-subunit alcohol dehydrogenase family)